MQIDSQFQPAELLLQNPKMPPCPDNILKNLGVMTVTYNGFDNTLHQGQVIVAMDVMPEVETFFKHALEIGFNIERVIPISAPAYKWDSKKVLKDNLSSGFGFRYIKGTNKISLHGQGRAFDINPRQNPYIIYKNGRPEVIPKDASWNPSKPGTLHAEHPLVKLMEGLGWEWGGHWSPDSGRTDYQHFQKVQ